MPDPASDLTPGAEPAAPAPPADPTLDQARALYGGLNNLDTRAEYIGKTLIPGQDLPTGMTWDQARAALFAMQQPEPDEPDDPWEQLAPQVPEPQFLGFDPQGQPVYDQQQYAQPAPFDPRSLQPVFESQREQLKAELMRDLQQQQAQQAWDQNLSQGVQSAATEHKLSDFARAAVEAATRSAAQQQPNRAPSEIAKEMAEQYVADANARFVAAGGVPPAPPGQVPNGPVPSEQRPRTTAEALEWSNRPGVMNHPGQ